MRKCIPVLVRSLVVCLGLWLAACSDSDDTFVPPGQGPNLALISIGDAAAVDASGGPIGGAATVFATSSAVASPGETIQFDFTVRANGVEAEHIGVHFFLIERSKSGQLVDDEEAETYDLGDFFIEEVIEGDTTYTAQFIVPSNLPAAGDYLIVAYVDAAGIVADDINLRDNLSRGLEDGEEDTYGDILIDSELHHDFIIHKVEVASGFILLPEPAPGEENDSAAPDEVESHIIGHIDATKLGSGVISARVAAEMIVGGQAYTAHLWTEGDDAYLDTMDIVFPNDFEEHYFPWDITVNGELSHALLDAFDPDAEENLVTLRFTIIDISADVEHRDDNNVLEIQVPYAFFDPETVFETGPTIAAEQAETRRVAGPGGATGDDVSAQNNALLSFVRSFGQVYGDSSKFAVSLNIGTNSYVSQSRFSAEFNSSGSFDIFIFNNSASLLGASAQAFAYGDTVGAGYNVGVRILGASVFSESDSVADRLQKSWDRTWEEERALFDARFVIAIVPLRVSAGIAGSVGFGAEIGFDNLVITATGDVFSAEISAFATAEINLLVASGGVGGSFLIISEGFSITGSADLTEAASDGRITLGLDIENELKAIEGDIFLFVKYPTYKFCCKFGQKEATKTIYNTGSLYDKTWTLFSDSRTLTF